MKTFKHIFAAAVLAVMASSCTMYQYTSRSVNIAQSMDVRPTQTLVDVRPDFGRRITVTSSLCKSESEAMGEAKFRAITENNIDIVVDPIYKTEIRGRKVRVTLSGYAGFYVNPRTSLEEIKQHDSLSVETIEKYLMLQDGAQIIPYLYQQKEAANTINIYHSKDRNVVVDEQPKPEAQAPAPQPKKAKK